MVCLLRHTEPLIAPDICYGQTDLGLHRDFKSVHLPEAISKIENMQIDAVYSSPLKRCKILANEAGKVLSVTNIIEDARLMELNFGDWELKSWDTIYNSERGKIWFNNFLIEKCPQGESFADLLKRAESFYKSLRLKDRVLIVTHAGFIRASLIVSGQLKKEEAFSASAKYGELIKINIDL